MRKVVVISLAIIFIPATFCVGQKTPGTWTQSVALSTGGEGWESGVAIDGAGNSVAVWDERTTNPFVQDRIWSRSRPANESWGTTTIVSPTDTWIQTTYVFPAVRVSAAGNATAIWTDVDGLWTADRSAGGVWSPSYLLVPGLSGAMFLMNSNGDAALLWTFGGPRFASSTVYAMRRPSGSVWGAQEVVATGTQVGLYDAALGQNGELMVAWEAYSATCTYEKCTLFDFILHNSREAAGSSTWQDSGPLLGPDAAGHAPKVAMDAKGHASMIFLSSGVLNSMIQTKAGATWSAPVSVYSTTNFILAGFSSDTAGNVTVALLDLAIGTGKVTTINGKIATNTWGTPLKVSRNDAYPSQVIYAGSSGGAAVLMWLAGDPSYTNQKVRVAVRPSAKAAWTVPQTISLPGNQLPGPEAAAVNASGNAVVIFSAFNSTFSTHTEYAANY